MKNVILYALIFSLLFNVFQYVNSTKILDAKDKEVLKVKANLKTSRDSVATLANANYFALESDEDAQEYFFSNNLDYQKVAVKVKEDLISSFNFVSSFTKSTMAIGNTVCFFI